MQNTSTSRSTGFRRQKTITSKTPLTLYGRGLCASDRTPMTTGSPAGPQSNQNVWVLPPISRNVTCQHAEDQQLYNCPTMTSWALRGSLSKRRELVLSSLPTRPPRFSPILGPRSLTLRVSFPCKCSPPVCVIRSVTPLSLATTT